MGLLVSEILGFTSKGVYLFSCISYHVRKKSTFVQKFAININQIPPLKKRNKKRGGVMETKRFHSLAYNKFYFNPNYKVVEPSKLVNAMPYLGIF